MAKTEKFPPKDYKAIRRDLDLHGHIVSFDCIFREHARCDGNVNRYRRGVCACACHRKGG